MLFKINYKLSQFHSHVVVNCKLGLLYAKSIWDNLRNNCETYFVCVYIQIRARTPSHAVHLKHTFAQLSLQIGQLLLLTTTIYCITAVKLQNCTFSHTNARTYTHSVTLVLEGVCVCLNVCEIVWYCDGCWVCALLDKDCDINHL